MVSYCPMCHLRVLKKNADKARADAKFSTTWLYKEEGWLIRLLDNHAH